MIGASSLKFDHPVILVMTATIDPGPYADAVARNDPLVRRQDYLRAIRYWQQYPDDRIVGVVFCDNSGADLEELKRACRPVQGGREVEVLGFSGNDRPADMHYGYAEWGTLDHVVATSEMLGRAEYFVKVTGRLVFPRLKRLLDSQSGDLEMSIDSRRAYARDTGPRTRVRTQLMIFKTAFYRQHLVGRRSEMIGVCTHIEEFLALEMETLGSLPGVTGRWTVECAPSGIAGNGSSFDSWRERAKTTVRAVLRRVAPFWWL